LRDGWIRGPAGCNAKLTVEDCIIWKIEKLFRDRLIGLWEDGGSLAWRKTATWEECGSVGYRLDTDFENWTTLTLEYTVTKPGR